MWEKEKNDIGIAHAFTAYGDLYRNGRTQGSLILPNYAKAITNYERAAEIFKKANRYWKTSINLWGAAYSQKGLGKSVEACKGLKSAEVYYDKWVKVAKPKNESKSSYSIKKIRKDLSLFNCTKVLLSN